MGCYTPGFPASPLYFDPSSENPGSIPDISLCECMALWGEPTVMMNVCSGMYGYEASTVTHRNCVLLVLIVLPQL